MPSASDSATSAGTSVTGTANSIGTNTTWVGTVNPAPMSMRTLDIPASASTYSAATDSDSGRSRPPSDTSASAATRKLPPTISSPRRSASTIGCALPAKDARSRSDSRKDSADVDIHLPYRQSLMVH